MATERPDHIILFDKPLIAVLGPPGSQWFEPTPHWANPVAR